LQQLEKEQNPGDSLDGRKYSRDNCCVTFTDASPDLEHALTRGGGHNCCVQFKSSKIDAKREHQRQGLMFVLAVTLMVCAMVVVITTIQAGKKGHHEEGIEFGNGE
jgi:hypothetical protein